MQYLLIIFKSISKINIIRLMKNAEKASAYNWLFSVTYKSKTWFERI